MRISAVAAAEYRSLAVTEAGRLFAWGQSWLGHGDMEPRHVPTPVAALSAARVCSVSAGGGHSLAVTDTGALYTWGFGYKGKLGHGDEEAQLLPKRVAALQERVCSVAAGELHSLAVTESGTLYAWGDGDYGKLGHGDEENQLLPKRVAGLHGVCCVAAGGCHTLAVANDGTAHGWGDGEDETLGLQLAEDRRTPLAYKQLCLAVP